MELWAIIAIIGATAQSLRTVCQKILIPRTGELGASFSRFVYGILFAWIWTFAICLKTGASLPEMNMLIFVFVGFVCKVMGAYFNQRCNSKCFLLFLPVGYPLSPEQLGGHPPGIRHQLSQCR